MLNAKNEYRDNLVAEYQSYAKGVTLRLVNEFSIPTALVPDMLAAANLGLVEAATKFDPTFGVDFKSYSYFRIRGEAIDFLRRNSDLSVTQYKYLRSLEDCSELAQSNLVHEPNPNTNSETVDQLKKAKMLNHLLESALIFKLRNNSDYYAQQQLEDYSREVGQTKCRDRLQELLTVLNDREYKLIYDYYFLDKPLVEIAKELNSVSKSWMSRMHKQALRKIRQAYQSDLP